MKNLNWLSANLHLPPMTAEAASALLFELGAQGLWEDAPDEAGRVLLKAGFPEDRADLAEGLGGIVGALAQGFQLPLSDFDFTISLEKNHDWTEKWKEGLAPIQVGPSLLVAPTWISPSDYPPGWEEAAVLKLDPGMAFGTGQHATTFLCLKGLVDILSREPVRSVLDVGFGSGILAMSAKLLNPGLEVAAVENDPETLPVAEENAALNNISGIDFNLKPLSELPGSFDLILANITQNPLLELAPDIGRKSPLGGFLILSGLLENQCPAIISRYGELGFEPQSRETKDEWAALVFKKTH